MVMGTVLKQIRSQKGFTQVEVADKANIAVRTYQNYEAGERTPNVHVALSLAKVLNCPVEELFPAIFPK
jgi:transcriptional regulator with XRE-family HTH domain